MLPLFHEYTLDHPRFTEHARVAYIMALVVPLCTLLIGNAVGWWNPWKWSACGVGIGLALSLHAIVHMHRRPEGLSGTGARLVKNSARWFPFFFVIIQSSIAALIVVFIWFSATSMALPMPWYAHAALILLSLLIPARRFVSAHILPGASWKYEYRRELLRGIWHALTTVLITRVLIGITTPEHGQITQGTIAWQTMLWVPAALYILFSTASTIEQLGRIVREHAAPVSTGATAPAPTDVL